MGGSTSLPDRHSAEVRDHIDESLDGCTIAAPDRRLDNSPVTGLQKDPTWTGLRPEWKKTSLKRQ